MAPFLSRTASSTTFTVTVSVLTTAFVSYCVHRIILQRQVSQWQEKRTAERKGRIRAEVKLRTALKQQQKSASNNNTFTLTQIGTVVSPYTKRMGTPRQGALCPSSRGYIEFTHDIQPAALEGLEQYSHIWILFEFHANTDLAGTRKCKIKPPRAPCKVGMLSTRSPHRPNPLGLSLVKFEALEGRKLYISALDLVNGTPVYDVKPCVPWDIPPPKTLVVPEWVSREDALAKVEFTPHATTSLQTIMKKRNGISSAYDKNQVELVQNAISEILAQDPRSGPARGTTSEKPYNIVFGSAQVEFIVLQKSTPGIVQVVGIHEIQFPKESYVDGIPLASSVA